MNGLRHLFIEEVILFSLKNCDVRYSTWLARFNSSHAFSSASTLRLGTPATPQHTQTVIVYLSLLRRSSTMSAASDHSDQSQGIYRDATTEPKRKKSNPSKSRRKRRRQEREQQAQDLQSALTFSEVVAVERGREESASKWHNPSQLGLTHSPLQHPNQSSHTPR